MARIVATAIVAVALSLATPRLAGAEVADVKLALQNGSNYLPLIVMQTCSPKSASPRTTKTLMA